MPFAENAAAPGPTVGRSASEASARESRKSLYLSWAIAAACAAAAGVFGVLALRARAPRRDAPVLQFEVRPPEGASFGNSMRLSPDGCRLAIDATDEKDRSE